jgi:hypothetical protein
VILEAPIDVDVVFIVDVTGSTGHLQNTYRAAINTLAIAFETFSANSRYALTFHMDFPLSIYGDPMWNDVAYAVHSDFVNTPAAFAPIVSSLPGGSGSDSPESQYTAVYQAITGSGVDLDNDGLFTSTGEVLPNNQMSPRLTYSNPFTAYYLFTWPVSFHNSDTDPNYPVVHTLPPPFDEGADFSCSEDRTIAELMQLGTTGQLSGFTIRANPKNPPLEDQQMLLAGNPTKFGQSGTALDDMDKLVALCQASGGQLFELELDGSDAAAVAEEAFEWFRDSVAYMEQPILITIEKTHNTIQGQFEYVSITTQNNPIDMGGFDFLIAYDASALTFMGAEPGQLLEDCGWEYFTYRYGADGNCGDACPSGLLRIIAIAETANGPFHPLCYGPPDTDPHELANMEFLVTNDRSFNCQYVPIRFFWGDCADNTISSVDGDTMYVSDHVYDFEGTDITDSTVGFPTYFGVQPECLTGGDPEKPAPISLIDFHNGGIDIICSKDIDDRGDINLDGLAYTIADAVMFSNYFVYGLSAFPDVTPTSVDGAVAATDVNADGLTLSVADLVYLVRVIVGDVEPYDDPYQKIVPVDMDYRTDNGVLSVDGRVGAALVILDGEVAPVNLTADMEMKYHFDGQHTRVLLYSLDNSSCTGDCLEVDGNIVRLEMATDKGVPVSIMLIPSEFALHQCFPNPFNPITTITFALPTATQYELVIFNVLGEVVETFEGYSEPGIIDIQWDASGYASGVYLYRLTASDFVDSKKAVLLK